MAACNVIIGNTGGGLIDFLIWGVFQPGSRWYWVIITGPFFSLAYYFVFKSYLTKKQLSIDVSDEEQETGSRGSSMEDKQHALASRIIEGLGGTGNIAVVNNCLTRLRVDIKDMGLVSEELLKKTGAMGFVRSSDSHIQVIYGPKVEGIASNVREILKY